MVLTEEKKHKRLKKKDSEETQASKKKDSEEEPQPSKIEDAEEELQPSTTKPEKTNDNIFFFHTYYRSEYSFIHFLFIYTTYYRRYYTTYTYRSLVS